MLALIAGDRASSQGKESLRLTQLRMRGLESLFNFLRELDPPNIAELHKHLRDQVRRASTADVNRLFVCAQTVERVRETLEHALATLARRRSSSRIAILSARAHESLLEDANKELFEMRLGLDAMIARHRIRRVSGDRLERFEFLA